MRDREGTGMLWFFCRWLGHRWRTTDEDGEELSIWTCRRIRCRAMMKAPWYLLYREVTGYGDDLHPIE